MDWNAIGTCSPLEGRHVRLEPLALRHAEQLREATAGADAWSLWYASVPDADEIAGAIDRRTAAGGLSEMTYAVVDRAGERAIGMTGYRALDPLNRRLEIGGTWYADGHRRTPINTEAKLMLLAQAFDRLDCVAVELRTHYMDRIGRRAIERLGAKLDGVLRSHVVALDGSLRDTCVYSVLASEWPAVRSNLRSMLP